MPNHRLSLQILAGKMPGPIRRAVKRFLTPAWFIDWLYPNLHLRTPRAKALEDKLWGGFSRYAVGELEALKQSPQTDSGEAAYAAWALAHWYAAERDFERTYDNLKARRRADPSKTLDLSQTLLETDCLLRLGDRETARNLLVESLKHDRDTSNLFLAMANTYAPLDGPGDAESDAIRLSWINRVYANGRLSPIAKADPARPLALDNLAAARSLTPICDGPKVTVIVPAHNAEATLAFALRGLCEQSWKNLEVIVVDDCSPDATFAIAEAFARRDPRIRVIRQERNQGAYAARNRGLAHATGDFILTHDADDWSHPQRIERQLSDLVKTSKVGNLTVWCRASRDLRFGLMFMPADVLVHSIHGSVLFRREAFDAVGPWDEVRASADTEFVWRVRQRWGTFSVQPVSDPATPLACALQHDASLTGHTATHLRTLRHGIRREYHEAAGHWHATSGKSGPRVTPGVRPFPAPGALLPDPTHATCDVLFVADFNSDDGDHVSTMNYVDAAREQGLSVALFHWSRYDRDVQRPLNGEIRQLAQDGKVQIVAPGEKASASTVIVGDPALLHHRIDLCPSLDFDRLVVLIDRMAERASGAGGVDYDPLVVKETMQELFGTVGIWAPTSQTVQQAMRSDQRYPPPHGEIWTPIIDTEAWCAGKLRWRGAARRRPVIGRHGRDHDTSWPASADALLRAYCASKPCDVVLMGGAKQALGTIGHTPRNWTVRREGAMEPRAFLSGLDFYVHHPDEDDRREPGRAPFEAMAAGVPVILPPSFREIFGAPALYAAPEAVWDTIQGLWSDEQAYLATARGGRDFVVRNHGYDQLVKRLGNLSGMTPCTMFPTRLPSASEGRNVSPLTFPGID
jgi:glycosyltransferase involved in cell wall biosynthesis